MTGPARRRKTELIECHDCAGAVSFTARRCPHCGSSEPRGPYRHSRAERRRLRIEYRNDRQMMLVTLATTVGGALYGVVMASGIFRATFAGIGYGTLGLIMGPPVAFTLRLFRR